MQTVPPDDYFHGNFSGERKETGSGGVGALPRKEAYRRVRRESEEEAGRDPGERVRGGDADEGMGGSDSAQPLGVPGSDLGKERGEERGEEGEKRREGVGLRKHRRTGNEEREWNEEGMFEKDRTQQGVVEQCQVILEVLSSEAQPCCWDQLGLCRWGAWAPGKENPTSESITGPGVPADGDLIIPVRLSPQNTPILPVAYDS